MVIEEAVTKGLAGLAAYIALCGASAAAVLRRVRAAGPREQTLAAFAGAALAGWFVQSQVLFYAPSIWLQHMLLLAFVAHLEAATARTRCVGGGAGGAGPGLGPGILGRLAPFAARARVALGRAVGALGRAARAARLEKPARAAAAAAALALAGVSVAAGHAIHAGNAAILRGETRGPFLEHLERSMRAFEPLANGPRVILFNNVAANWSLLAAHRPAEARRLLAWCGDEAEAALAAEPESWVIHHALARLYRAAAETHPEYAAPARRHFERSLALAPNLDPLQAPLGRAARR